MVESVVVSMKAALMLAASRIGFIDFLLQEPSQEAEVLGLAILTIARATSYPSPK
jgi:NADH:ubiquinone oxidoreductase subunit K